MHRKHVFKATANSFAVLVLLAALLMPFYFAKNFAKVAGVKSTSPYLVVSQIDKFPNLTLTQEQDTFKISLKKYSQEQLFTQVLILNNPTERTQTYQIDVRSGETKVFFGENPTHQTTKITVPQTSSVPVSLFSENGLSQDHVEFTIEAQ